MSIVYFIVNLDSDKDMNLELYVLQIHILSTVFDASLIIVLFYVVQYRTMLFIH